MNLAADDFEIFGLPRQFRQDLAAIDQRWKLLQREAHPDRYAAHGASAQRLALQWSTRINEARQRLKDPLKRASYLCRLGGVEIDAESNTAMPAQFLMQQMEWREALAEAADQYALQLLQQQLLQAMEHGERELERLLDQQGDAVGAAAQVRALMFVQRLQQQLRLKQQTAEAQI